jgi:hypothetical protein
VAAALLTHGADVHATTDDGCVGRSLFLGNGRRAPRRNGRLGRDRCNADVDAHADTHARLRTQKHTHSVVNVQLCMRLHPHTQAHTEKKHTLFHVKLYISLHTHTFAGKHAHNTLIHVHVCARTQAHTSSAMRKEPLHAIAEAHARTH